MDVFRAGSLAGRYLDVVAVEEPLQIRLDDRDFAVALERRAMMKNSLSDSNVAKESSIPERTSPKLPAASTPRT
jgi:hypothetical protein